MAIARSSLQNDFSFMVARQIVDRGDAKPDVEALAKTALDALGVEGDLRGELVDHARKLFGGNRAGQATEAARLFVDSSARLLGVDTKALTQQLQKAIAARLAHAVPVPSTEAMNSLARSGSPYLAEAKGATGPLEVLTRDPSTAEVVGALIASFENIKSATRPSPLEALVRQYDILAPLFAPILTFRAAVDALKKGPPGTHISAEELKRFVVDAETLTKVGPVARHAVAALCDQWLGEGPVGKLLERDARATLTAFRDTARTKPADVDDATWQASRERAGTVLDLAQLMHLVAKGGVEHRKLSKELRTAAGLAIYGDAGVDPRGVRQRLDDLPQLLAKLPEDERAHVRGELAKLFFAGSTRAAQWPWGTLHHRTASNLEHALENAAVPNAQALVDLLVPNTGPQDPEMLAAALRFELNTGTLDADRARTWATRFGTLGDDDKRAIAPAALDAFFPLHEHMDGLSMSARQYIVRGLTARLPPETARALYDAIAPHAFAKPADEVEARAFLLRSVEQRTAGYRRDPVRGRDNLIELQAAIAALPQEQAAAVTERLRQQLLLS